MDFSRLSLSLFQSERCDFGFDLGRTPLNQRRLGNNWNSGVCYRAAIWKYQRHEDNVTCSGKLVRGVCNLSRADLDKFHSHPPFKRCLLANKFNLDVDAAAVMCQVKRLMRL